METVIQERYGDSRPWHSRISWGAIFGGLFVALAVHLLLLSLGGAIGLSAIEPRTQEDYTGIGVGSAIWTALTLLIGTGAGGYVASYLGATTHRADGVLHGLVTACLALVLLTWLVGGTVARTVSNLFGFAGQAALTTGSSAASSGQLSNVDQGDLEAARSKVEQALPSEAQTREVAQGVADVGAGALWGTFIGVLLGMLGGIFGGLLGTNGYRRRVGLFDDDRRRIPVERPHPTAPLTPTPTMP
jgi:hypothetical protein